MRAYADTASKNIDTACSTVFISVSERVKCLFGRVIGFLIAAPGFTDKIERANLIIAQKIACIAVDIHSNGITALFPDIKSEAASETHSKMVIVSDNRFKY